MYTSIYVYNLYISIYATPVDMYTYFYLYASMLAPPAVHPDPQSRIQGKVHAVVEHHVASGLHLGQDPPENRRATGPMEPMGPMGPMGSMGYGPSEGLSGCSDAMMPWQNNQNDQC